MTLLVIVLVLLTSSSLTIVEAQSDTVRIDSIGFVKYNAEKLKLHSPQRAAMYSAVLPGLGQIYNRSYWKLPLVYGGLGFLGYYLNYYSKQYQYFRTAYIYDSDGNPLTDKKTLKQVKKFDIDRFTGPDLASARDFYRRQRDLTVLGLAGVYVACILDATVEGYLFSYDVSEDLSLKIKPAIIDQFTLMRPGVKLSFRF